MQDTPVRPEDSGRKAKVKYSRVKRKILRHVWAVRAAIILGIFVFLGIFSFGTFKIFENLGIGNIFALGYDFITAPTDKLAQTSGRTNILIMGKAGGSHEGPDLTDTMLLVSVGLTKPGVVTVSIPRDLWIPDIRAKINSAYYWGKQKSTDTESAGKQGIVFARSITEEVVGTGVQYGVVIDFSAFKEIVDTLGGIEVDVQNSFTDELYPIQGKENDLCDGDPTFACRYETISFNAGSQKMDGDTALKFVRSRHSEGAEGTDTARAARQQKIIDAIKNKITDPKVFLSIKTDLALFKVLKKYVETDMDSSSMVILGRKIIEGSQNISQYLLPEELLVNPPINKIYDRQYVFVPKAGNGNWTEINEWFASILH